MKFKAEDWTPIPGGFELRVPNRLKRHPIVTVMREEDGDHVVVGTIVLQKEGVVVLQAGEAFDGMVYL